MKQKSAASLVAIVIPIYKAVFSNSEKASLRQCLRILSAYPVKIVKPYGLNLDFLLDQYPALECVPFENQYFSGTDAYNRLLTSVKFYERFVSYEFILIYQLDAYVFRDELIKWCLSKFDYIGAPSLHHEEFNALPGKSKAEYANALSSNRIVLNGGLSLRRVSVFIRYLKIYNFFYPKWLGNEDMLFSQEATRLIPMKPFIKLPTWREALRFSFEKSPAATFELNGNELPFACHAWERYDPEFWSSFINITE